jgi:hypothetical protein
VTSNNDTSQVQVDWDKVYNRFRNQIEHENNLYNQRILWLIYIQALLFATLGLMTRARLGIPDESSILAVDLMISVVCFLGMFIAVTSKRVLDNAGQALDELRDHWNSELSPILPAESKRFFPHISGGLGTIRTVKKNKDQLDKRAKKTIFRSRHLPASFVVAWFAIFIIMAVSWFSDHVGWLRLVS